MILENVLAKTILLDSNVDLIALKVFSNILGVSLAIVIQKESRRILKKRVVVPRSWIQSYFVLVRKMSWDALAKFASHSFGIYKNIILWDARTVNVIKQEQLVL